MSLQIQKTIKLYIDGKFPRTESGRSYPQYCADGKTIYANICQASRKDFRSAVDAAIKGASAWKKMTAYNRAQILYRLAEMLEGKKLEFSSLFQTVLGWNADRSESEIRAAIDACVYYAGWADKYQQIASTVNPVSGPHHNFSSADPVGVTVLVCSDEFRFEKWISDLCAILASGNSCVVLLGKELPAILAPLAEALATSDLPEGAVNLLTGNLDELAEHFGSHMEVRSVSFQNSDATLLKKVCGFGVENMKRVVGPYAETKALRPILNFVETKTIWHPIGQ